jgi:hypothetical protein
MGSGGVTPGKQFLIRLRSRPVLEHFKNRKLICYKGSVNVQSSDIATIEPIFISQFGCEATLTTRAELGVRSLACVVVGCCMVQGASQRIYLKLVPCMQPDLRSGVI